MLFVSQLLNTTVYDNQQVHVGYITDIIVKPSSNHPPVVGLEVQHKGTKNFIKYQDIESLGEKRSTLNISHKNLKTFTPHKGDLYLHSDLLERQIVDTKGARVVRVNDIQLGKIGSELCLMSLAVGSNAIFRRLGLNIINNLLNINERFIEWDAINIVDAERKPTASLQLKMIQDDLSHLHPADIANIIERLNTQQRHHIIKTLSEYSEDITADVLREIEEPAKIRHIFDSISLEKAVHILEEMEPDDAATILDTLPEDKVTELLKRMEKKDSADLEELLSYEEGTAAAHMNPNVLSVLPDHTVKQAIQHIQTVSDEFDSIYYVYVTTKTGLLKGVLSVRTLLVSKLTTKIKTLMQPNMITVSPDSSEKEVILKMTRYNLLALCVTDEKNHLLGTIAVDDVLRLLVPSA